jgi:hypothetical protein
MRICQIADITPTLHAPEIKLHKLRKQYCDIIQTVIPDDGHIIPKHVE